MHRAVWLAGPARFSLPALLPHPNPFADHNPPCTPSRLSTPVGGLTLALSRENSVKGGQAACASRERSVRDGSVRSVRSSSGRPPSASPLERSVSSGQRTYRGLQLADNRPTEPAHHLRRLEEAFGCGSADWMGNLPPARLADMVRLRLQLEGAGGAVGGPERLLVGSWLQAAGFVLPRPDCLPTRVSLAFELPCYSWTAASTRSHLAPPCKTRLCSAPHQGLPAALAAPATPPRAAPLRPFQRRSARSCLTSSRRRCVVGTLSWRMCVEMPKEAHPVMAFLGTCYGSFAALQPAVWLREPMAMMPS